MRLLKVLLSLTLVIMLQPLSGCSNQRARITAPSPTVTNEVLLYFNSSPHANNSIHLSLSAVSAISQDGASVPLMMKTSELSAESVGQELLAKGSIPEGSYKGLVLIIEKAWQSAGTGEPERLLVSSEPVFVPVSFDLDRRETRVLDLTFYQQGTIHQDYGFVPSFFANKPASPILTNTSFASSPSSGRIFVFDRRSFKVTGAVFAGEGASGLALDTRRNRLYVALRAQDKVAVIDVTSGSIIADLSLQFGDRPEHLALTSDGLTLLCVNTGSDSVSFVDPISMVEISRTQVEDGPKSVRIDNADGRAFVCSQHADSITVLDIQQQIPVASIPVRHGSLRGAFNQDGSRYYAIHRNSPFLSVVDSTKLAVIDEVLINSGASDILYDSHSDLIYIGWGDASVIDVYSPFSQLPVNFISVPNGVLDMAIDTQEARLFAASPAGAVTVIDTNNQQIIGGIDVGNEIYSLALMQ